MPAPDDLQEGGQLGILARELRILCGDVKELRKEVGTVKENVAYIRGKLAGEAVKLNGSTKIKVSLISSLVIGISGIIVAVIAFFKPV